MCKACAKLERGEKYKQINKISRQSKKKRGKLIHIGYWKAASSQEQEVLENTLLYF